MLDKDKDVDKKAQEGTPLKDAANHSSKVDLSAGGGHASSSNLANSRNTEEPREERVFDERKLRLRKWFDGIPPNPVPINTNAQVALFLFFFFFMAQCLVFALSTSLLNQISMTFLLHTM